MQQYYNFGGSSFNDEKTIITDTIFKEEEIDKGFIIRANEEVSKQFRQLIKQSNEEDQTNMQIININKLKQQYGLLLNNTMYLCTMVDLPCLIEAQKTLDFKNYYKSVDIAQLLYVHNYKIDKYNEKSRQEILEICQKFNPLTDQDFFSQLYKRTEITQQLENNQHEINSQILKFRSGLSVISKNIKNVRFNKELFENKEEVHEVEKILKDIIDYGFANNVEEDLLEFNDEGKLIKTISGVKEMLKQKQRLLGFNDYENSSVGNESQYYQSNMNPMSESGVSQSGKNIDRFIRMGKYQFEDDISQSYRSNAHQDQRQFSNQIKINLNEREEDNELAKLKQDLSELKKLIKITQKDIEHYKENNKNFDDLQIYYKSLIQNKKQLKKQIKILKQ